MYSEIIVRATDETTPPPAYSEDDDGTPPSFSECVEQQPPFQVHLTIDELSVDNEAVTAIQETLTQHQNLH